MSDFIAEARVLVLPDVTKFRAELEASLLAATAKPVVVPVTAARTSLIAQSAAASGAMDAEAAAVRNLGAAHAEAAVAARGHSKVENDVQRGAIAAAASFTGLRGAVLAASTGFLAGTIAVKFFGQSVQAASDETEQLNKTREVFGAFAKEVEDFAATSATSFGESRAAALELVSTFGALLRPIGFTQQAAERESVALTKLGADLASFFNTDVSDALAAIQSGLVGQVRPLRRYGVELSAARVNALALADSGKKVATSLTDQEKVAARIKIIFQDSTIAQGDFARTSQSFANQTRILSAEIANLQGELGRLAIPVLTTVLQIINLDIQGFGRLAHVLGDVAGQFKKVGDEIRRIPQRPPIPEIPESSSGGPGGFLQGLTRDIADFEKNLARIPVFFSTSVSPVQSEAQKTAEEVRKIFEAASDSQSIAQFNGQMERLVETLRKGNPEQQQSAQLIQDLIDQVSRLGQLPGPAEFEAMMRRLGITIDGTTGSASRLTGGFEEMRPVLFSVADAARDLASALGDLQTQSSKLSDELLRAQNQQASPQSQIEILRQQKRTQEAIIANLKQGGITAGEPSAIRSARNEINRIIAEINGLQGEIDSAAARVAADQRKAVSDTKRKADEAQRDRDKQFQALAEAFGGRQQNIEDAISRAGIRGDDQAQRRLTNALIRALERERRELRRRLQSLKVSVDVRKQIFDAIARALEQAKQDKLRFEQEQKENLGDALIARLDIRIQIAEVRGNVSAQLRLHRQKLEELRKELRQLQRQHKGNTIEALNLKLAIAEEEKALKDLGKQTAGRNDALKRAEFEFLQTQTGFVSNLLGNLIPSGSTGGLVGGAAGSQSAAAVAAVPRATQREAAAKTLGAGPTRGQAENQTTLLRRIVQELHELNRRQDHPEARNQRRRGSAVGDIHIRGTIGM